MRTYMISWFCLLSLLLLTCTSNSDTRYYDIILSQIDTTNFLTRISSEDYELGAPFAFINQAGDTIIPFGKYYGTHTDTIKTFGIMYAKDGKMSGIDKQNRLLFEVFKFDNGPDYLAEGLFRVMRNEKIGFANQHGEIIIPCQFDCAYFFENGQARVANDCATVKEGDHSRWISDEWYYIDKNGKRVEN